MECMQLGGVKAVEFMNSFSNNLKDNKAQDIILPTEEQLQEISCLSSLVKV